MAIGTLYDVDDGLPAFLKRGSSHVIGELVSVDTYALAMMDAVKGCPREYRREKIFVQAKGLGTVLAWVYVINSLPENARLIVGADWRAFRLSQKKQGR